MTTEERAQEIIGGGCNKQNCSECGGNLSVVEGCVEFRHLKEMASWKEKQMIEKACEWLDNNLASFWQCKFYNDIAFIDDFRKAMEE